MFILTTGGAAYIGSHTFIALGESGFDFVEYAKYKSRKYIRKNKNY